MLTWWATTSQLPRDPHALVEHGTAGVLLALALELARALEQLAGAAPARPDRVPERPHAAEQHEVEQEGEDLVEQPIGHLVREDEERLAQELAHDGGQAERADPRAQRRAAVRRGAVDGEREDDRGDRRVARFEHDPAEQEAGGAGKQRRQRHQPPHGHGRRHRHHGGDAGERRRRVESRVGRLRVLDLDAGRCQRG
jgi:hypothetical protein